MISAIGSRKNVSVLNSFEYGGIKVEVLQYDKLSAPQTASQAERLWFMKEQNLKVRQLAIYLNNDKVQLEAGAMSYFKGNIEMISGVNLGNAVGRFLKGAVTGEAMAKPEYSGTGLLVSEPSFRYFIGFVLEPGESVIVDKGMFYMATKNVKVEPVMQQNISSGMAGGEGWFQIQLSGEGLVICESPVPMDEIDVVDLENETLRVDGNFALLRDSGIRFSVERSAKTLMGSAMSGEGLVNVYRGTGKVFLAPTIKIYSVIN